MRGEKVMTHKNAITEARDALVKAADVNGSLGGDYPLMKQCETAIAKLDALIAAVPDLEFRPLDCLKDEDLFIADFDEYQRKFIMRAVPIEQYINHRKAAKILQEATGETPRPKRAYKNATRGENE
jgi:hypothetical protein